ncbi:hypothetical protein NUU61_001204 [Penicillium alfredii]|uniref:C2H2-type domain-containing protein n=1 Tax=Penicillium alfredii TaxID=1506179 RepID=A0A9W9GCH4_9EURO|nr:uncharacterized protein NUU61_001204 [Penicillium alfredii]KAJ5115445.1 hypothetical protein NUU61_001204 [Penicillium alfredii]
MRVLDSPSNALLDFDRVDAAEFLDKGLNDSVDDMPTVNYNWQAKATQGPVPGCAGSVDPLAGLMDIPVGASSSPPSSSVHPAMDYVAHSDSVSFLAPESYLSSRRASCVSDTVGSVYAWSSPSNTDFLTAPSPPVDPSVCSGTHSPFMQSYYPTGPSQPALVHPQLQEYTAQQIDKWCIESDPAALQFSRFPPSTDLPLHTYPDFSDGLTTAESWLPLPAFTGPSTSTASTAAPDHFLAPSPLFPSTAPVSIESSSVLSDSPAPTLSDLDSPPSRARPSSPSNPADLSRYGIPTGDGAWRCAHPGCSSQALFRRGCDLRKHFNRHRKHLFCRHENCPQSVQGGFSSKKDRARHEAKHNPGIVCEWDGCGRVFSRVDNMKDHVRRIHRKVGSR